MYSLLLRKIRLSVRAPVRPSVTNQALIASAVMNGLIESLFHLVVRKISLVDGDSLTPVSVGLNVGVVLKNKIWSTFFGTPYETVQDIDIFTIKHYFEVWYALSHDANLIVVR
jgi:hypothetical protein